MREIKFRAWDGERMMNRTLFDRNWYTSDDKCIRGAMPNDERTLKVMQYTGLKDKNGKGIYESDIIQDDHYYRPEIVEWAEGGFWLREDDDTLHMPTIMTREVIGNIYENPELLK